MLRTCTTLSAGTPLVFAATYSNAVESIASPARIATSCEAEKEVDVFKFWGFVVACFTLGVIFFVFAATRRRSPARVAISCGRGERGLVLSFAL
jgi:hypothetical protein